MINIGIVGCGFWGHNLIRNFAKNHNCQVRWICDIDESKLKNLRKNYTGTDFTVNLSKVLNDKETDAVVIATPFLTHFDIAKKALLAGKHIFIEKPFVENLEQAKELIKIANKKGLIIMVGYVYVYSPSIQKIKEIIHSGELGSIYYIHSTRVNLGIFRYKESVIWDLVSHDFSIILNWLERKPETIFCSGNDCLGKGYIDTAHISIKFKSGPIVYVIASWLSPIKMRNMIIAGSKKMIFFNDERTSEKIKIYDKGLQISNSFNDNNRQINYKNGSVVSPWLNDSESLEVEVEHFLTCIKRNKKPITDGLYGLKILKAVKAAEDSFKLRAEVAVK